MDAAPFRLTFGVELEFIAHYNPEDYGDELLDAEGKLWSADFSPTLRHKYGILVRHHMIQILNENGVPANCGSTEYSKWTVDDDATVTPDNFSEDWCAIELRTPVLIFSTAALEQVETVVKVLVSKFKLYLNESCGMHVHVGNGEKRFDLRTLKNFCSLVMAFERQLDSLHPPYRLSRQNWYSKPMRWTFNPRALPGEKLSIIDNLKTIDELVIQFHRIGKGGYNRHMAYNFFNLRENLPQLFRTIEFRQHRGTLDPKLITKWVMVACNLVNTSYTNGEGVRNLVEQYMDDTKYTVVDLLKDLQLSDLAEFYAPRVYSHHEPDQNAATVDGIMEHEEPAFIHVSPGEYDTPWEKEFTPRPRPQLRSYELSADTDPNSWESQGNSKSAYRVDRPWESQSTPVPVKCIEDGSPDDQIAPNLERGEGS